MNTPNVDAMNLQELEEFRKNLHQLTALVTHHILAHRDRKWGDIESAQKHEFSADCYYKSLPEDWRW